MGVSKWILDHVSENTLDPALGPADPISNIAALIWEVFDAQLDSSSFDFVGLARRLVNVSEVLIPQDVLDTCDAIFGSGAGCQRLRFLNQAQCHNIQFFERLLLAILVSQSH